MEAFQYKMSRYQKAPVPGSLLPGIVSSPIPSSSSGLPSQEQIFRQRVREGVQKRLKVFSQQENFFISLVPLVIAYIAWEYALNAVELSARYRIGELKKLSRLLRNLKMEYDNSLKRDLSCMSIEHIGNMAEKFKDYAKKDFFLLYLSMHTDVQRMLPDDGFLDMRTQALCSFVMLELHRMHGVKSAKMMRDRCVDMEYAPTPILDALREAMDAYISPQETVISENAKMTVKILYNKLLQLDFSVK